MRHIVDFSGGKDSTDMLCSMIELNMKVDDIICIDTTKEFPEMYEHINKVEIYINRKITKVKIPFDYYFSEHIKTKGTRKGEKGYGWPDFRNRWCTALKRQYSKKYKCKGDIEYQGIAFDEIERCQNNKTPGRIIKYPLVEWKRTENECLSRCYDRGFNWGGLYEKLDRVSCYLCPLSKLKELKFVHDNYPELWKEMMIMNFNSKRTFRSDYSLSKLNLKFKK